MCVEIGSWAKWVGEIMCACMEIRKISTNEILSQVNGYGRPTKCRQSVRLMSEWQEFSHFDAMDAFNFHQLQSCHFYESQKYFDFVFHLAVHESRANAKPQTAR